MLLLDILIYSYLLLPLCFIIAKGKIKVDFLLVLALYGLVIFSLPFFHESIPNNLKKYRQAFYTLVEYSFFTYLLYVNIRNQRFRKFIVIASVLFLFFEMYYVSVTSLQRIDSIPVGIETILVFIYIFFFFFDFSKQMKNIFIYNHYCFWLSVGILIYLGGSFFYYILANHFDQAEADRFVEMTWITEIIKNFLFAVSIFMYKKHPVNNINKLTKDIPNLDMI